MTKLFEDIGPRFHDRPGGYTRIIKRHQRRLGDAGQTAILELLKEGREKGPDPGRAGPGTQGDRADTAPAAFSPRDPASPGARDSAGICWRDAFSGARDTSGAHGETPSTPAAPEGTPEPNPPAP